MDQGQITELLRTISGKPDVVLVGGQAIVLWTYYYEHTPEFLSATSQITTWDIDFLGSSRSAREVAASMNARIAVPSADDFTPSNAVLDLGQGSREEDGLIS